MVKDLNAFKFVFVACVIKRYWSTSNKLIGQYFALIAKAFYNVGL